MKKIIENIWEKCEENFDGASAVVLAILLILALIALAIVTACAGYAISAVVLMWLWNLVMPLIWVGAPKLTFWVALGLLIICRLLFAKVVTITKGKDD